VRRYVAFAPGAFATRGAKTAHGVIAYGTQPVVAVVDPEHAGRRVREVVPYLASDAPIVASVVEALAYQPNALLIGVAPAGGALPATWRAEILRAIAARLEIVSGLHDELGADLELAAAASRAGTAIVDLRKSPPPRLFSGEAYGVTACVALLVGSDCAVGKMTAALELTRAARESGIRAEFVATGQTGIAIAGSGTAIDRVVADFASGAVEELVLAHRDADLLFVEGQGGINHPAFAPVTLALLFGALLPLVRLSALYEGLCASVKPAAVAGIALDTHGLDAASAARTVARTRDETGLPCDDVVRNGAGGLYRAMAPAFSCKTRPHATQARA